MKAYGYGYGVWFSDGAMGSAGIEKGVGYVFGFFSFFSFLRAKNGGVEGHSNFL
jgi:hypothetical protein